MKSVSCDSGTARAEKAVLFRHASLQQLQTASLVVGSSLRLYAVVNWSTCGDGDCCHILRVCLSVLQTGTLIMKGQCWYRTSQQQGTISTTALSRIPCSMNCCSKAALGTDTTCLASLHLRCCPRIGAFSVCDVHSPLLQLLQGVGRPCCCAESGALLYGKLNVEAGFAQGPQQGCQFVL